MLSVSVGNRYVPTQVSMSPVKWRHKAKASREHRCRGMKLVAEKVVGAAEWR